MEKRCGTCKYLVGKFERRADGSVKARFDNRVFDCAAPMPEIKRLPACVVMVPGATRRMMTPGYGVDCPAWEQFK